MFIESARLKNFGIVEEEEFTFSSGINMFYGENGEGKSTVLKALSMMIFNQYSGKISDYIKWGHEEEGFDIGAKFNHQNVSYTIDYFYSEKKSSKKLTNLDTGEVFENSAVNEYLNELFDMKRAVASIVSFENNIDLITTSPSERREYLKGIYDLNFKDKIKGIDEELLKARNDILVLQQKIRLLESREFEKLALIRKPFSADVFEEYQKDIKLLREDILEAKQRKAELERLERDLATKERDLKVEKNNKRDIEDLIESLDYKHSKLEKQLKDYGEFSTEKFDKEKEIQMNDMNSSLLEFRKEYKLAEKERDSLVKPSIDESNKAKLKEYEENIVRLSMRIEKGEEDLITFKSGKCPTCGKIVDESFIEKTQTDLDLDQEKLENTKKSIARSKDIIEQEKLALKKYEEEVRNNERLLTRIEREIEEKTQTIEFLDERINNKIEAARNTFNRERDEIKNNIVRSETRKESQELKLETSLKKIEELESAIEKVETELRETPYDNTQIYKLETEIRDIQEKTDNYTSVLTTNKEKKRQNIEIGKKQEANQLEIEETKALLEKAHEIESITTLSKKILSKEFPSFVISRMIKSLKMYVNEFLAKVYPKYDLNLVENKNSLSVLFGPKQSDVKLSSGFEQQIFSFAWKYALGKIQNYGLLMLDEVDSAASVKNSEKFYNTLAKMDEYFRQVFVISHKPEIQELLSNDYQATVYSVENGVYSKI